MKTNKLFIFQIILILLTVFISSTIFGQGYNRNIYVYYNSDFEYPFDYGNWQDVNINDVKDGINQEVESTFENGWNISVIV